MDPNASHASSEEVRSWMLAAKHGDRAAMGRLYGHLLPLVTAYLRRRMGAGARRWIAADALASDILCETILGLASLPPAADERDLHARLLRIARSRLWDALRRHGNERGESWASSGAEPRAASASTHTVTRSDERRFLRELVTRLSKDQGTAVRLCGIEGCTYAEAGALLGLEPDTVRKRYHAGLLALRRLLGAREV